MDSPLQAAVALSQWQRYVTLNKGNSTVCLYCHELIEFLRSAIIRVGCIVQVWEEDRIIDADGNETIKLRKKRVPMHLKGLGCPTCQYLLAKLEAEEMARYEAACKEWHELHKPQVVNSTVTIKLDGTYYHLLSGKWFDAKYYKVPTMLDTALHGVYAEQFKTDTAKALAPWMRALGIISGEPVPNTKQPDSQTRTPSKRIAYIDVTDTVLKLPKRSRTDLDTATSEEIISWASCL